MADATMHPNERQTLGALRYAVNDEAATYLAIMRLFTTGMSGFLSDQSADEITERLLSLNFDLDRDTVDSRLSYLVEHGNLARSPRETEARSVREYLSNRARYQLTPRGELVHRQVEELLAHSDGAREVSSEMLPSILGGIQGLARIAEKGLNAADPSDIAGRITTLFAQFEVLVTSTRQFYSYLTQVLTRFDLGRDEFVMFKTALIDYLQRFVDEVARHMPQVADELRALEPSVPELCAAASTGTRLVGIDGGEARRAAGLEPDDWLSLYSWFVGGRGRRADADNVRHLATEAMRSLLTNLRRIAAGSDRQQSQYWDLVRLAGWFEAADDGQAHALWAATFGLYSARHLCFAADVEGDPIPATQSWWRSPVAEVPVGLRTHGDRQRGGRATVRPDYSATKRARLRERKDQQVRRLAATRELAAHTGTLTTVQLSDEARTVFLDLFAVALTQHGRPLNSGDVARGHLRIGELSMTMELSRAVGAAVRIKCPAGTLALNDLAVHLKVDGSVEAQDMEETRARG